MRKIVLTVAAVAICAQLAAQTNFKKNTAYAEILGNGLVLSVNYERQLGDKPGFGIHAGIGLGVDFPAIPLGVNYLWNLKNQRSFLEAGFGITLAKAGIYTNKLDAAVRDNLTPGYIPSIGYRHHTRYGLLWKLIFSPAFSKYRNLIPYGGFSLGWRF